MDAIPLAGQDRRNRARRILGDVLVARAQALVKEKEIEIDHFAVRVHPGRTLADREWLKFEWAGPFVEVLELAQRLRIEDDASLASLRQDAERLLATLERADGISDALRIVDDRHPGWIGPTPVLGARLCIAGIIGVFVSLIEAVIASDATTSSSKLAEVHLSTRQVMEVEQAVAAAAAHAPEVNERETLTHAFGAPPAGEVASVETAIRAYQDIDPFAPAHVAPSPRFDRPPSGVKLNRADRLMILAERQARVLALPSGELTLLTVQDYFQCAFRLATQNYPVLALLAGHWTSALLLSAHGAAPDALRARLSSFDLEDTLLIITDAVRADDAIADGERDARRALNGYRTLVEAVVRPWVRLLLDVHALANGDKPRRLPATTNLSSVIEPARKVGKGEPPFDLLIAPVDMQLRNAEAHERIKTVGGKLLLIGGAGETLRVVEPVEVHNRYWLLRSGFAGVDCARSAFGHATGWETPEFPMELTVEFIDRMVRLYQTAHDLPLIAKVADDDGVLLIDTEAQWAEDAARNMVGGLKTLVPDLSGVVLRWPDGQLAVPLS